MGRIAGRLGQAVNSGSAGILLALSIVAAAIGSTILWVLSQLPLMPAVPDPPAGVKWLNWVFPVVQLVGVFSGFVAMYITWLGIRIVARWVKAV
ncbi:hypothetical protein PAI11_00550 [Patulibacter medicamentivorans]|uniref:Uncharacterized protein n=1 Tax=Patulibacter medicamentivorans TaxID=1097667 RepID=H0DZV0_9ACTN|nr:hypothetical protein PAI11_00550 [Patulibacter medicamentivorans]